MKNQIGIIIFELFVFLTISFVIMAMFSSGVDVMSVQFVSILIFIAVMFPLFIECRVNKIPVISAKNVVLVGPLLWILLDGLTLREGIEEFAPEIILQAFSLILIFIISIMISYIIKWPSLFVKIFNGLDYEDRFYPKRVFNTLVFCLFCGLLPLIIWGGGLGNVFSILTSAGRWNATWLRARFGGPEDYIKSILGYFLIAGLQFSWFYLVAVRKRIFVILLSLLALWVVFNTGTRTFLLSVFAPLLVFYYLMNWGKNRNKIFVIGFVGFVVLVAMQFQFIIRKSSREEKIINVIEENYTDVIQKSPIDFHRDDQFYQLLRYVNLVPGQIPYSGEIVALRLFYHPIPRFLWKNKPEGITRFFEEETNSKGIGMATFSASIIGDFYLAQGWLGVIIAGFLIGFLAKQFDSLKEMASRSPAVLFIYSYGIIFMFTSIRSYMIIYEGWYVFILLYILFRRIRKKELKPFIT